MVNASSLNSAHLTYTSHPTRRLTWEEYNNAMRNWDPNSTYGPIMSDGLPAWYPLGQGLSRRQFEISCLIPDLNYSSVHLSRRFTRAEYKEAMVGHHNEDIGPIMSDGLPAWSEDYIVGIMRHKYQFEAFFLNYNPY